MYTKHIKTCTKNAPYSCYCAFFLLVFSCMPPKQLASGSLQYHYYYYITFIAIANLRGSSNRIVAAECITTFTFLFNNSKSVGLMPNPGSRISSCIGKIFFVNPGCSLCKRPYIFLGIVSPCAVLPIVLA